MIITDYSDLELMNELLRRHTLKVGPSKVSWSMAPYELTIGIGRDFHASIYIDPDAYDELRELL